MQRDTEIRAALDRVLALSVFVNEDMSSDLAARGLTTSRAHLLWELKRLGPSTQRALADPMGVSARNVTGLVDALVATGFVTRETHPTDRRATLVTLTAQGETETDALDRDHEELARTLFAAMPAERFQSFVIGLDDVLAALQRAADEA